MQWGSITKTNGEDFPMILGNTTPQKEAQPLDYGVV